MAQRSEAIKSHDVWRLACNFTEPYERLFAAVTLRALADGDREFVDLAMVYFEADARQPGTMENGARGALRIGYMERIN